MGTTFQADQAHHTTGQSMHVALIVDDFPLPPHNGVTIPTSQILKWMIEKGWQVDLYMLSKQPMQGPIDLADGFTFIQVIRTPANTAKRLFDEIILGIASFANWTYGPPPEDIASKRYDLIVCSPISTLDFQLKFKIRAERLVAAINDVYTAVLDTYPFDSTASRLANRLRGLRMRSIEARMLSNCRTVLVQTPADLNWLGKIGGDVLKAHGRAIHNAASEDLISAEPIHFIPGPRALFIADLSNTLYQNNLVWLHDCWAHVVNAIPQAKLRVVGRGLETNPVLFERLSADPSIELTGFVNRLVDAYQDVRVVAAPIFKTYGFMDKVAEAAAMGLPVVGDVSAFNGMESLLAANGSIAAADQTAFTDALIHLLTNDSLWRSQAQQAKLFARQELTIAALHNKLDAAIG